MKHYCLIVTVVFLLFSPCFIFSQTLSNSDTVKDSGSGKIEILQDVRISQLVEKHIEYNQNQKGIPGFRVQIFFDSGNNARNKANVIKAEFIAKYPEVEAYLLFQEPNFKVRVGDFRTRLDAERFEKAIENSYQGAYVVIDEINLPKLGSDNF
jgi:hypothetical protein